MRFYLLVLVSTTPFLPLSWDGMLWTPGTCEPQESETCFRLPTNSN